MLNQARSPPIDEAYLDEKRFRISAILLFIVVTATETLSWQFTFVQNIGLLIAGLLVVAAGYSQVSFPSALAVGLAPKVGTMAGYCIRDWLVTGRVRGSYWLTVFSTHRFVGFLGATVVLFGVGVIVRVLAQRLSRGGLPAS